MPYQPYDTGWNIICALIILVLTIIQLGCLIWQYLPSGPWDLLLQVEIKIVNFGYKILKIEENLYNRFNFYGVCFDIIDTLSCFICNKLPGPSPKRTKKKQHHTNHLCNYRLHRNRRPRNHCNRGCHREPRAYKQRKKHKTLFPKYGINVSFLSILPVTTYSHRQRQRKIPRVKQKRSNKHKRKRSKKKQEEAGKVPTGSSPTTFTDWFKNLSFYLKFQHSIQLSYQKLSHWKWYCALRHHINSNFFKFAFVSSRFMQASFLLPQPSFLSGPSG